MCSTRKCSKKETLKSKSKVCCEKRITCADPGATSAKEIRIIKLDKAHVSGNILMVPQKDLLEQTGVRNKCNCANVNTLALHASDRHDCNVGHHKPQTNSQILVHSEKIKKIPSNVKTQQENVPAKKQEAPLPKIETKKPKLQTLQNGTRPKSVNRPATSVKKSQNPVAEKSQTKSSTPKPKEAPASANIESKPVQKYTEDSQKCQVTNTRIPSNTSRKLPSAQETLLGNVTSRQEEMDKKTEGSKSDTGLANTELSGKLTSLVRKSPSNKAISWHKVASSCPTANCDEEAALAQATTAEVTPMAVPNKPNLKKSKSDGKNRNIKGTTGAENACGCTQEKKISRESSEEVIAVREFSMDTLPFTEPTKVTQEESNLNKTSAVSGKISRASERSRKIRLDRTSNKNLAKRSSKLSVYSGDLVLREKIMECTSELCMEEALLKETPCCPLPETKIILKLQLDENDNSGEYLVVHGPMYVRKSMLSLSVAGETTLPARKEDPSTISTFEDCKKCCKAGKCIADKLINICKNDPDSIIKMYRSQTVDEPWSDVFQLQKTHGDVYGDVKYHFLMVDKTTSYNNTNRGEEMPTRPQQKEDVSINGKAGVLVTEKSSEFMKKLGAVKSEKKLEIIATERSHEDKDVKLLGVVVSEKKLDTASVEKLSDPDKRSMWSTKFGELKKKMKRDKSSTEKPLSESRSDIEVDTVEVTVDEKPSTSGGSEGKHEEKEPREDSLPTNNQKKAYELDELFKSPRTSREAAFTSSDSLDKLAEEATKGTERTRLSTFQRGKASIFDDIVQEEKLKSYDRSHFLMNSKNFQEDELVEQPPPKTKCCGLIKTKAKTVQSVQSKRTSTLSRSSDGVDTDSSFISVQDAKNKKKKEKDLHHSERKSVDSYRRRSSPVDNPVFEQTEQMKKYLNNI